MPLARARSAPTEQTERAFPQNAQNTQNLLAEKCLPQNAQNTQNLLAEKCLPQIGTDAHRLGGGCVKTHKWHAPKGQKRIAQGSALGKRNPHAPYAL